MNNIEKWKPIAGYENQYEVSSFGRVKSLPRTIYTVWRNGKNGVYFQKGRILALKECSRNNKGYQTYKQVCFSVNGIHKYFLVHRLVAEAFIPKPKGKDFVNHKDGNKHNNRVDNLEWVTQKENVEHSLHHLPNNLLSPVKCVETGEIFKSQKEASEFVNIAPSVISLAASGKRKTAGGYHWAYTDNCTKNNDNFIKDEKVEKV